MIRRVVVVLLVLVLLVAGGGYMWWRQASLPAADATPGAAMNPLERWCADQLRRIADRRFRMEDRQLHGEP